MLTIKKKNNKKQFKLMRRSSRFNDATTDDLKKIKLMESITIIAVRRKRLNLRDDTF